MFTGLIEGTGEVKKMSVGGDGALLAIRAGFLESQCLPGDSISINGVCLTLVDANGPVHTFDVSLETLSSSNLGELQQGSRVNLERALKLSERLGGHLVTGHVDGIGHIVRREPAGTSVMYTVQTQKELMPFIVRKGSIALDGISLTVNEVKGDMFTVNIIPHSFEKTTLNDRKVGSTVNIETDLIGKYVARLLSFPPSDEKPAQKNDLDLELLREHGFV